MYAIPKMVSQKCLCDCLKASALLYHCSLRHVLKASFYLSYRFNVKFKIVHYLIVSNYSK